MRSHPDIEASPLYNADLAPVTAASAAPGALTTTLRCGYRCRSTFLTYMLAASLIQGGMDWKQAVLTVFLGNTIVLVPMLLNSHPGARYGIPFPVLARASFGVLGRERCCGAARSGCLRMVRHSDLDRRRSDQQSADDLVARVGQRRARHGHLLLGVLGSLILP